MIQIPQERILSRISLMRQKYKGIDPSDLHFLQKRKFYPLIELLGYVDSLYLSHNGDIYTAMPFDEFVAFFGLHSDPKSIPVRRRSSDSPYSLREILVTEDMKSIEDGKWSNQWVDDISIPNCLSASWLWEYLFELERGFFKTNLVQPGFGLRIDKEGPLRRFYEYSIGNKIPLIIAYGAHEETPTNGEFCFINAIEA